MPLFSCFKGISNPLWSVDLGAANGITTQNTLTDGGHDGMTRRLQLFIAASLVIVVGGGLLFLASWDIPAPSKPVTKTLNNDRFPS